MLRDRLILVILGHFLHFYSSEKLKNENSGKNEKDTGKCYHFTQLYQKQLSYDACFPKQGV